MPRECPRGTQVTLCNGIVPSVYNDASAWPACPKNSAKTIVCKITRSFGETHLVISGLQFGLVIDVGALPLAPHDNAVLCPFEVRQLDFAVPFLRRLYGSLARKGGINK
jgi:hypothetical protein